MNFLDRFWYWYLCLYEQQGATGARPNVIHTQAGYGIVVTFAAWASASAVAILSFISSAKGYSFSTDQIGIVAAAVIAGSFLFEYLVLGGSEKRESKIQELRRRGVTISPRRRHSILVVNAIVFFLGWFFLIVAWRLGISVR